MMFNEGIIGKIGKWWVMGLEEQAFYGQLKQEGNLLYLCTEMISPQSGPCTEMVSPLLYEWMREKKNFIVHGQAGTDKITLRGTNLDQSVSVEGGEQILVGIHLIPEECFIGQAWVPEMVAVKSAYVKYDGIEAWCRQNSYQEHVPFSQDAVLLSFQQNNPLSFALDGFDLKFDFGLSYSQTEWDYIQYSNWVNTVFFPKQRPLVEFCERVNQFSQLLSLFSHGKVPYSSMTIETTAGFSGEYVTNPVTQGEKPNFWLTYPKIADSFEAILQKWFRIAAQAKPILEIVTQALALNKPDMQAYSSSDFLSLVQALEVYSNYFRASQAKQYAQKVSGLPEGQPAPVELSHKLCDLFQNAGAVLGFSDVELWKIANKIAASYDYYFSYNPDRKYDGLTAGQTESLLMFAQEALKVSLLREIGVPDGVLQQAGIRQKCQNLIYPWILKAPQIAPEPCANLAKIY